MLRKNFVLITMAASLIAGAITARAQDAGALLDLLVKKRIITDQEAEEVRGELVKDVASTSAGKLKLSAPITEVELYGDMRVRYEARQGETGAPSTLDRPNDTLRRSRERYRLRLGLRGTLADDWFFGLRLETSTNPRSTNVTFGDDAGPFGKTSDAVGIGQAYLGYSGLPRLQVHRRQDAESLREHSDGLGRRHQPRRHGGTMETHLQSLLRWRPNHGG